ncbi:MAG: hypothetical protein K2O16_08775, partial [Lachnospiraceae bacterium]|nr:hypothetical protein [Lachnospiraceae bacterium]
NGIFALSNHFLTTSAVNAQVCVNSNIPISATILPPPLYLILLFSDVIIIIADETEGVKSVYDKVFYFWEK